MSNLIKCFQCKNEYDPAEHNDVLPDNMHVWGVDPDEKIPKCPDCGMMDFMDIAARQIANDPRFKEVKDD